MKNNRPFSEVRAEILQGKVSVLDLVHQHLAAAEKFKNLNAFLEIFSEEAVERAKIIDKKIASKTGGRLAGMILGIKDVFCYKDHKVSAGSKILSGFESQFTSTAIQRLLDEDAIIIGRQNCDEFAMGSSNENSGFGPVLNYMGENRVPGGSSGGSAVGVQAGICMASIASDTGGSIRQPAAFCGLVGLKPTYSRISRSGLVAYGSSFDCVGPITRSVEDAALLLEIMAGEDPMDSTSSSKSVDSYSKLEDSEKKYTIGYLGSALHSDGLQNEIKLAYEHSINVLKDAGHKVELVELPWLDYVLPVYYVLTTSESSSNLSRFDGIHYGHRSEKAKNLEEVYKLSRTEAFGPEVQRRIMLGTFALSADYYEAYFTKAQQVRRLIQNSAIELFKKVDFLIMPTTPTTAFKIGEKSTNPLSMYLADIFTVWANLAGIPAVNIPVGIDNEGMPIGLQVHADFFKEKEMLQFANDWSKMI